MTALVGALLALPVLGALGAVFVPARTTAIVRGSAVVTALGWVVIAGATGAPAGDAVEFGRLVLDPITAAALAGTAAVVALVPPRTRLAASAALSAITAFGATASVDEAALPARPFAAGLVLLAVLGLVQARAERSPGLPVALATAGALAVAAGLAGDTADRAATLAVAGCGAAAVALVVALAPTRATDGDATPATGPISPVPVLGLVPALALAAVRLATPVAPAVAPTSTATDGDGSVVNGPIVIGRGLIVDRFDGVDPDPVVLAGLAVGAVALLALVLARGGPWWRRMAAAAPAAGVVLVAQAVPDLHRAGVLVLAGGVLATAAAHPAGLVALLPGAAAVASAAGAVPVDEPAAALGLVGVLAVAAVLLGRTGTAATRPAWPVLPAIAFGILPASDWAGGAPDELGTGVAVAVAAALAATVGLLARPAVTRPAVTRPALARRTPTRPARTRPARTSTARTDTTPPGGGEPDEPPTAAARDRRTPLVAARPTEAARATTRTGGILVARRRSSTGPAPAPAPDTTAGPSDGTALLTEAVADDRRTHEAGAPEAP